MLRISGFLVLLSIVFCGGVRAQAFPDLPRPVDPPIGPDYPIGLELVRVGAEGATPQVRAIDLVQVTPPDTDIPFAAVDPFGGIGKKSDGARLDAAIIVNQNPIAGPDVFTTPEGVPLTVTAPGHLANDYDPDGDTISWLSYQVPANGVMSGTQADGAFVYTPNPGFSGLEQMTYAIGDGQGGIAFGELLIFVIDDQNRSPVAVPDVYTTPEGVPLVVSSPGHLGNDFDLDGDDLEWLSYTVPSGGTMSGTQANGAFVYTPNPGFSGVEEISYAIGDGKGGIAFGNMIITVLDDQNRPPVAVPDVYTTSIGEPSLVWAQCLLANDFDPDGDDLEWLSYSVPSGGTMSGTQADGAFVYTPNPGFSGVEEISYAIGDGRGGIAFGDLLIHVLPESETTPVAISDVFTTQKGVQLVVPAPGHLANDFDPNGDPVTWLSYTVPSGGTMTGTTADGAFVYTPNAGFSGLEELSYAIGDGNGGIAFGKLLILVLDDQNRPPVAIADVFTTPEGVQLVVPAPGHLANDFDLDGDPVEWLSYTVPSGGTMSSTQANGAFVYTPNPGFSGLEEISYAIGDGNGGIAFGDLLILVLDDQNRSPIAIPDVFTTPEGVPLVVSAPGHLVNDIDQDGDAVEWLSYTVPSGGTMSSTQSDGAFVYTPNPGFNGLEDLTYAIGDGQGGIAFGKMLIFVGYDPPSQAECVPPDLPFWDGNLTISGGVAPTATVNLTVPNGFKSLQILPGSDNIGLLDITGISPLVKTGGIPSSLHPNLVESIVYDGTIKHTTVTAVFGPVEQAASRFLFLLSDQADCALQVDPQIDFGVPTEFALHGNYPNPFNPTTRIAFSLPEAAQARLAVYDVTGRHIKTLVSTELDAGKHDISWDGTDHAGRAVSSGVYFYRIETDGFAQSRIMTLVK